LAEATVWPYHPQVRQLLDAAGSGPRRASAIFCYPPLPATDYRWHAELGGGALWDLGPYAVSVGRVLFGAEPEAVGAHVLARARGVDTSFCMWADYGSGRGLTGLFGADVSYSNNLELLTDDTRIRIERVFTTPPELENVIDVHGPAPARLHTPAVDSFAEFLLAVGRAIAAHDHHSFASNLLADARTLARLREAAGACT
jgi:predicted dehydrogenase